MSSRTVVLADPLAHQPEGVGSHFAVRIHPFPWVESGVTSSTVLSIYSGYMGSLDVEHRSHPRVSLFQEVTCEGLSGTVHTQAADLGVGGMFIDLPVPVRARRGGHRALQHRPGPGL